MKVVFCECPDRWHDLDWDLGLCLTYKHLWERVCPLSEVSKPGKDLECSSGRGPHPCWEKFGGDLQRTGSAPDAFTVSRPQLCL